jgi:hypothetical protein
VSHALKLDQSSRSVGKPHVNETRWTDGAEFSIGKLLFAFWVVAGNTIIEPSSAHFEHAFKRVVA